MSTQERDWTLVITPKNKWYHIGLRETWQYRDLVWSFVIRDFRAAYKQTILGPLWFIIQPLMTTLVSMLIFGKIAQLSEDGTPQFLFFFSSTCLWSYLSNTLTQSSNTFISNAGLFSKIYYPRLITPVASTITASLKLTIPFLIFVLTWLYYFFFIDADFQPTHHLILVPGFILIYILIGNSLGIIIAAFTTKYRDLRLFVGFGVQLLMYLSAVQYSISKTPSPFDRYLSYNPLVTVMEAYRFAFFGQENSLHTMSRLGWTLLIAIILGLLAVFTFNRVEKNFIDTV